MRDKKTNILNIVRTIVIAALAAILSSFITNYFTVEASDHDKVINIEKDVEAIRKEVNKKIDSTDFCNTMRYVVKKLDDVSESQKIVIEDMKDLKWYLIENKDDN